MADKSRLQIKRKKKEPDRSTMSNKWQSVMTTIQLGRVRQMMNTHEDHKREEIQTQLQLRDMRRRSSCYLGIRPSICIASRIKDWQLSASQTDQKDPFEEDSSDYGGVGRDTSGDRDVLDKFNDDTQNLFDVVKRVVREKNKVESKKNKKKQNSQKTDENHQELLAESLDQIGSKSSQDFVGTNADLKLATVEECVTDEKSSESQTMLYEVTKNDEAIVNLDMKHHSDSKACSRSLSTKESHRKQRNYGKHKKEQIVVDHKIEERPKITSLSPIRKKEESTKFLKSKSSKSPSRHALGKQKTDSSVTVRVSVKDNEVVITDDRAVTEEAKENKNTVHSEDEPLDSRSFLRQRSRRMSVCHDKSSSGLEIEVSEFVNTQLNEVETNDDIELVENVSSNPNLKDLPNNTDNILNVEIKNSASDIQLESSNDEKVIAAEQDVPSSDVGQAVFEEIRVKNLGTTKIYPNIEKVDKLERKALANFKTKQIPKKVSPKYLKRVVKNNVQRRKPVKLPGTKVKSVRKMSKDDQAQTSMLPDITLSNFDTTIESVIKIQTDEESPTGNASNETLRGERFVQDLTVIDNTAATDNDPDDFEVPSYGRSHLIKKRTILNSSNQSNVDEVPTPRETYAEDSAPSTNFKLSMIENMLKSDPTFVMNSGIADDQKSEVKDHRGQMKGPRNTRRESKEQKVSGSSSSCLGINDCNMSLLKVSTRSSNLSNVNLSKHNDDNASVASWNSALTKVSNSKPNFERVEKVPCFGPGSLKNYIDYVKTKAPIPKSLLDPSTAVSLGIFSANASQTCVSENETDGVSNPESATVLQVDLEGQDALTQERNHERTPLVTTKPPLGILDDDANQKEPTEKEDEISNHLKSILEAADESKKQVEALTKRRDGRRKSGQFTKMTKFDVDFDFGGDKKSKKSDRKKGYDSHRSSKRNSSYSSSINSKSTSKLEPKVTSRDSVAEDVDIPDENVEEETAAEKERRQSVLSNVSGVSSMGRLSVDLGKVDIFEESGMGGSSSMNLFMDSAQANRNMASNLHPSLVKLKKMAESSNKNKAEVIRLEQDLERAKSMRKVGENRRDQFLKRAKALQDRANRFRAKMKKIWDGKLAEEKVKTGPLESICSALQSEMEAAHRERLEAFEIKMKPIVVNEGPSLEANYKIRAARVQCEIFNLVQKLRHTTLRAEHEQMRREDKQNRVRKLREEISIKRTAITTLTKGIPCSKIEVRPESQIITPTFNPPSSPSRVLLLQHSKAAFAASSSSSSNTGNRNGGKRVHKSPSRMLEATMEANKTFLSRRKSSTASSGGVGSDNGGTGEGTERRRETFRTSTQKSRSTMREDSSSIRR